MPFRETPRQKPRPRWSAQLDIEGVPRERIAREQRTAELYQESVQQEQEKVMAQTELDINNPPKLPYKHQEYPKRVYKGAMGKTVNNAEEEKLAAKDGYGHAAKPETNKKMLAQRKRENVKAFKGVPAGMEEVDATDVPEAKE